MALSLEQFYSAPWVKWKSEKDGDRLELRGGLADEYNAAEIAWLGINAPVQRNYDPQKSMWTLSIPVRFFTAEQLEKFNVAKVEQAKQVRSV